MNRPLPSREKTSWIGISGECVLAIVKGSVGFVTGSKALIGDAIYTGADAAAKAAEYLPGRFRAAAGRSKTGQASSPEAERKEPIPAILLSVLIFISGLQIIFSAVRDLTDRQLEAPGQHALTAVLLAYVAGEILFQFQFRALKNRGDGSHAVYANHHRYSLYTTLTVMIGIALSMTGGYLDLHPLLYSDPIAGLLAGCLVLRRGYVLVTGVIEDISAQELPHKDTAAFLETVQRVHGVIRVNELKARERGRYLKLRVKISVNPRITVLEAQEIAECARKLLLTRFVHVNEVQMEVVPYDSGYPYKSNNEMIEANDIPTLLQ